MALQTFEDFLIGKGYVASQDDDGNVSWERTDPNTFEAERFRFGGDASPGENPLVQEWQQKNDALLQQYGQPALLSGTNTMDLSQMSFVNPATGEWFANNSNVYGGSGPTHSAFQPSDYFGIPELGLAGNSLRSQERWAAENQNGTWDKIGDFVSRMPVYFAAALTGGAAGAAAGGAGYGTVASNAIGGAVGGGVAGGFSGETPSLSGAAKGAALGGLGGAAKGLIGDVFSGSLTDALPDATPTGTFPDSGPLASAPVTGELELLSGAVTDPNIAGLTQMGVDAGLSGDALQAFVDSGGAAGSTAAGGGGAASLSNLISGGDIPAAPQDPGYVTDPFTGDTVSSGQTPGTGSVPSTGIPGGDPISTGEQVQPWTTNPSLADLGDAATTGAASGVKGILDIINENKGLVTLGTGLIGSLIQGATAPSVAKAKAEAEAEAAKQLENERRAATSMSGVRFNVRPTGRMLRSPGLIGRPV